MASTALWQAYTEGDLTARDRLLNEHLGLVHHVARQLSRSLAADTDFDELVSCGTIGLINAIDAFDLSRGLAFSTFAVPRIRGAILDELRRQDHVPRSVRRKTRDISGARETLTRIFGRPATDKELAEHLGVDLQTFWRWQAETESAVQVSLDQPASESEGQPLARGEAFASDSEFSIEDELSKEQEREILQQAIRSLKDQERIVLTLYYFEELKLHEIADVLGLTESRVSQIRAKALSKLRVELSTFRTRVA